MIANINVLNKNKKNIIKNRIWNKVPLSIKKRIKYYMMSKIRFGNLRRLTPISRKFGYDRGQPIDRFYIENFLNKHAQDVHGRVMEVGDATYTRRFGGDRVAKSDVLHITEGNPEATIVADLTNADQIPSDAFDCIILTQTLQYIYDIRSALATIYRILKPGGIFLATIPVISQVVRCSWGDNWYWAFTDQSSQLLFEGYFSKANVQVEKYGNVLAAIAFLHGIAQEELTKEELLYQDDEYQVTITVRAIKST